MPRSNKSTKASASRSRQKHLEQNMGVADEVRLTAPEPAPPDTPGEGGANSLTVPALRASMGDWIYYIAFMKLRDIAGRVEVAEEIHKSERLKEMIQRQLKASRAREIKGYLLTQPQRFFSTAVIGVYGGEPRWYELSVRSGPRVSAESLPPYIEGVHGVLELSGDEVLFALDGQHRIVGIQLALDDANAGELGDEEMSVIFVAHRRTEQGQERTRRLFSTLNRHAKPVSKKEIIALDEDDVIAIITRELVDSYPLFTGKRTSTTRTSSIPPTDLLSFTTITTLYDSLDAFLRTRYRWQKFKRKRPSEQVITEYRDRAIEMFDILRQYFPLLDELARADDDAGIPGQQRRENGGSLLFRPIGLTLIVKAVRELGDQTLPLRDAVRRLAHAPLELDEEPWVNLLWDPVNRRMSTKAEEQKAALRLLVYGAGGDLGAMGISETGLRRELAGLKNLEPDQVNLRRFGRLRAASGADRKSKKRK